MAEDVFVITVKPDGVYHRSMFPHPLITLDYDAGGDLIQVVSVGPVAHKLTAALKHAALGQEDRDA